MPAVLLLRERNHATRAGVLPLSAAHAYAMVEPGVLVRRARLGPGRLSESIDCAWLPTAPDSTKTAAHIQSAELVAG